MRVLQIVEAAVRYTVWPLIPEALKRRVRPTVMWLRGDVMVASASTASQVIVAPASTASQVVDVAASELETLLIARRYQEIINGGARQPGGGTSSGAALTSPLSIDALVGYAHHAAVHSHDAMLQLIHSFHYEYPVPPADPFSPAYKDFWSKQYEAVAQRTYTFENELHDFDPKMESGVYPYNTRDPKIIAAHVIAAGAILEAIPFPPPARVLELGVGFGNTAFQIGLSGYDVTVLDIEKKYLDSVKSRFDREGLSVNCVHGEFFEAANLDGQFDVILFYECFHHCLEHVALLAMLKTKLTARGVIIFAGEAIDNDIPFPWGLNTSGQAVWSIRHFGWMELCFREDYFLDLLHRVGFTVSKSPSPHSSHSVVYTATAT